MSSSHRWPTCVGFLGRVSPDPDHLDQLRQFCREQHWRWRGLVAGDDLSGSLFRNGPRVRAMLITGRVVAFDAVVVPSYTFIKNTSLLSGMEFLAKMAQAGIVVLSATGELTVGELAWLAKGHAAQNEHRAA